MAVKARGITNQLFVANYGDIVTKADGTISGSVDWIIYPYEEAFTKAPQVRQDTHPKFPDLLCQETTVRYEKPGAARIIATYEGTNGSTGVGTNPEEPNLTQIEVVPSLREIAIDQHEKFPGWRDYAIFDEDTNEFRGWNITPGTAAEKWFQGLVSYLDPTITLRRSYVASSPPSMANLRKIFTTVPGAPNVGSRNWLLMAIPYRDLGTGQYPVTEEYLLSGPDGHNPYVYGSANL
tara:strand:+ start:35292 stop:35999 length:708 start_codon:yes stop_codon:yes gene_type:complete